MKLLLAGVRTVRSARLDCTVFCTSQLHIRAHTHTHTESRTNGSVLWLVCCRLLLAFSQKEELRQRGTSQNFCGGRKREGWTCPPRPSPSMAASAQLDCFCAALWVCVQKHTESVKRVNARLKLHSRQFCNHYAKSKQCPSCQIGHLDGLLARPPRLVWLDIIRAKLGRYPTTQR